MRGRPADLGESTGGGGGGETGRAHRRAGSTFATAWTLDGAQSLCPRDRQAANECRLRVPLIVFLSFVSSASESEKDPLKPTGSVPRKRTGATLSPRGEAGAPNGFVQEKRQQRGRAAAGSREGMDRAPGLVAALVAWPGLAGASAPSCLGRETTGRAGLPEGAYWALCVLQKSPPSPPCRRRASVSRSAPRNCVLGQPARNIPALILWWLILSRVSGQLEGFHPNTRLLREAAQGLCGDMGDSGSQDMPSSDTQTLCSHETCCVLLCICSSSSVFSTLESK